MRYVSLAMAACVAFVPAVQAQPQPQGTVVAQQAGPELTLADALARAESVNPVLRSRQAQLAAAEGTLLDARARFQSNPQLSVEGTRRSITGPEAGPTQREWNTGIAQTFEVGGQPSFRRESASAAVQALRFEIEDLRLQQRAEVGRRFFRVLALQRRIEVETLAVRLFEGTAAAVERRRAAGEDTRLDANVALVEWERARNQLTSVQEQLLEARSALASPLQLPAGQLPIAHGPIEPQSLPYGEAALLREAGSQVRLQALAARERSAQARLRLEQAARTPDVTLGLNMGREGPTVAREHVTTLSISVPLPLFRKNAAGIGAARAEVAQTAVEREAAERDTPTQVHALWLRLQSLSQRIERLERSVLPTLTRNEQLAARSQQAGQIGLLEVLVANRQVLDARRDLLDAVLDYQNTRLTLEATAGWTGQP